MNGTIGHRGPKPNSVGKTGVTALTVSPVDKPQVMTDMISIKLTIVPVISWLPNCTVNACKTTVIAIRSAVRVIQRTFS
jgi:3-oxoacyl-(acyl-carrier-protein) synthase